MSSSGQSGQIRGGSPIGSMTPVPDYPIYLSVTECANPVPGQHEREALADFYATKESVPWQEAHVPLSNESFW